MVNHDFMSLLPIRHAALRLEWLKIPIIIFASEFWNEKNVTIRTKFSILMVLVQKTNDVRKVG
jgi:hypothetical protein